jgi:hypothetical protein
VSMPACRQVYSRKLRKKYRRDQHRYSHVACDRTKDTGHLLQVAGGVVVGRHYEGDKGGMFCLVVPGDDVSWRVRIGCFGECLNCASFVGIGEVRRCLACWSSVFEFA